MHIEQAKLCRSFCLNKRQKYQYLYLKTKPAMAIDRSIWFALTPASSLRSEYPQQEKKRTQTSFSLEHTVTRPPLHASKTARHDERCRVKPACFACLRSCYACLAYSKLHHHQSSIKHKRRESLGTPSSIRIIRSVYPYNTTNIGKQTESRRLDRRDWPCCCLTSFVLSPSRKR